MEKAIPYGFRIKPLTVHSPDQFVFRIDLHCILIIGTCHSIRMAKNQITHQPLLGPTLIHETSRKMIKKFWMRWRFPAGAKVINAAYNPFTKKLLPDSINCNPSG